MRHRCNSIKLERHFLGVVNLLVATHIQLSHPKMPASGLTSKLPLVYALLHLTQELRMAGDPLTPSNIRTNIRILPALCSTLLIHLLLNVLLLVSHRPAPELHLHTTMLGFSRLHTALLGLDSWRTLAPLLLLRLALQKLGFGFNRQHLLTLGLLSLVFYCLLSHDSAIVGPLLY